MKKLLQRLLMFLDWKVPRLKIPLLSLARADGTDPVHVSSKVNDACKMKIKGGQIENKGCSRFFCTKSQKKSNVSRNLPSVQGLTKRLPVYLQLLFWKTTRECHLISQQYKEEEKKGRRGRHPKGLGDDENGDRSV